jgi:hypothetical protein
MLCASIILPITPPALLAAAARIGERPPAGGDLLQSAEQHVRRSIAAGQRHAEPAQQRREEREKHAGAGKGQPMVASRPA